MTYQTKIGETITDVCYNSAGSILAWEAILDANNFTDWTPDIEIGQIIEIPNIVDSFALNIFQNYPVNNSLDIDIIDFENQVEDFINSFPSVYNEIFDLPNSQTQQINLYTVKIGETIGDVILNATGNLLNWQTILDANNFTDWNPDLYIGQQIIIPSDVDLQLNVLNQLTLYPVNNDSGIPDIDLLIIDFINTFTQVLSFTADSTLLTMDATNITADYL